MNNTHTNDNKTHKMNDMYMKTHPVCSDKTL